MERRTSLRRVYVCNQHTNLMSNDTRDVILKLQTMALTSILTIPISLRKLCQKKETK